MALFIILGIHLAVGYGFCSFIASRQQLKKSKIAIFAISLITSITSIPTVVLLFVMTPGLNRLPGSFMEGALFTTFPLFFGSFTLIYYFIAKTLLKMGAKGGHTP